MESAGEALERDVFQMLRDGVSALAHGASTESLEQALSENVRTRIAREIELYRRNAQITGLCELPEIGDIASEHRVPHGAVTPLLEGVASPPLPAKEQADTARTEAAAAARRQSVVMPILKQKRWSRGKWATKSGVGKNCVYEYLDGKRNPGYENRKAMADALELDVEELPD
jgi:hypothetical protein